MTGFKSLHWARLAMVGFMAFAASSAVTVAHAEEEGELAKNLLGKLGFLPEDKDPIEYRERAPLVVPKGGTLALPPPVEGGYGERKLTNWPKDPDVAAARERKADAVRPRTQTEEWNANRADGRLPADQLKATRSAGRDPNDRTPVNAPNSKMNSAGWVPPAELRKMGRSSTSEETAPGAEPSRKALTDPPSGYRKAAGGGTIKPTYDAEDKEDPSSAYYIQNQKRKRDAER